MFLSQLTMELKALLPNLIAIAPSTMKPSMVAKS